MYGFVFLFICSRRLVLGWQQIRVPPAPTPPELEVCGAHAVTVHMREGRNAVMIKDPPIITKYKGKT